MFFLCSFFLKLAVNVLQSYHVLSHITTLHLCTTCLKVRSKFMNDIISNIEWSFGKKCLSGVWSLTLKLKYGAELLKRYFGVALKFVLIEYHAPKLEKNHTVCNICLVYYNLWLLCLYTFIYNYITLVNRSYLPASFS